MFKLLFQAGMNILNHFFFAEYACHLSEEELEEKTDTLEWKTYKKKHFLKKKIKWASTKSKIPEMGQPKSGIP